MPFCIFFFNDPSTSEIYTLSLHDALPICKAAKCREEGVDPQAPGHAALPVLSPVNAFNSASNMARSEEHTSELQSQSNLVCRLLLEKKIKLIYIFTDTM